MTEEYKGSIQSIMSHNGHSQKESIKWHGHNNHMNVEILKNGKKRTMNLDRNDILQLLSTPSNSHNSLEKRLLLTYPISRRVRKHTRKSHRKKRATRHLR